jgi:hypothetical protein
MNARFWWKLSPLRFAVLSRMVLFAGLSAAGAAEPALGPQKAADAENWFLAGTERLSNRTKVVSANCMNLMRPIGRLRQAETLLG